MWLEEAQYSPRGARTWTSISYFTHIGFGILLSSNGRGGVIQGSSVRDLGVRKMTNGRGLINVRIFRSRRSTFRIISLMVRILTGCWDGIFLSRRSRRIDTYTIQVFRYLGSIECLSIDALFGNLQYGCGGKRERLLVGRVIGQ